MSALIVVAFVASGVTTAMIASLLPRTEQVRSVGRAAIAGAVALVATVPVGLLARVETAEFLVGVSFAATPVAVMLGVAADDAIRSSSRRRDVIVYVWAGLIFPLSVIAPSAILGRCASPDCRVEDFGAALPLLVSSAAAALLAWGAPREHDGVTWRRFALVAVAVWVSSAAWLASIEGAIDVFTPRILAAALFGPVGGAGAWVLVDVLRGRADLLGRSAAHGALAGFIAIMPGAATLSFPWSLAVGALASAVAAVVYGSRRLGRAGRAAHWAAVVLTAAAVGFFAPAVSGDAIGFIFSGRLGSVAPPVVMFAAVALFGLIASAPLWLIGRRRIRSAG